MDNKLDSFEAIIEYWNKLSEAEKEKINAEIAKCPKQGDSCFNTHIGDPMM